MYGNGFEYSNYSYGPCVIRAGSGIDSDSEPPTYRMFDYTTNKYGLLGFRVSLLSNYDLWNEKNDEQKMEV